MANVEWHHFNGQITDPSGVMWVQVGPDLNKHAISAGGFIGPLVVDTVDGVNEDTTGVHIDPAYRIIGSLVRDEVVPGYDTRFIQIAVAGPRGSRFRAHCYTITED